MDKIRTSYRKSKNIYDDVLTQGKWWSRLYIRIFWGGTDDNVIAEKLLGYIPDDFEGKLLDVPVGTAVFTYKKYKRMVNADITCLDYSPDMLSQARTRFETEGIENTNLYQGDVGALPFKDEEFDIVLSMNGMHAFPDKEKAYSEIHRVLKAGGLLAACFYIRGKSRITDFLVNNFLSSHGWFTPLFESEDELRARLERKYRIIEFHTDGSMVCFLAERK